MIQVTTFKEWLLVGFAVYEIVWITLSIATKVIGHAIEFWKGKK